MDKLQIGETIFRLRKKKKITQEELGKFIGVSTAAVSKWESGNSYPDITFLPLLADFFDVSIDKLLNYKVELSDVEAKKITRECIALFNSGDFCTAISKSEEYILKYKNSYLLKLKMACLFIMYLWKANDEERIKKTKIRIKELFEDIVQNAYKEELVEQALYQLSGIYCEEKKYDKAIKALNKIRKSEVQTEVMLASIYIQRGDLKKGREIFQSELYKNVIFSGMICNNLAWSYVKNEKDLSIAEKYYNLSINIKKAFVVDGKSALNLWRDYLGLVSTYLKFKEGKKSIDMLYSMVKDMKCNDVNKLDFSSMWYLSEMDKNDKMEINSYEVILKRLEKPEFDLLKEEKEFKNVITELKKLNQSRK